MGIVMKTPHKHAELIKAWADGAEIQYRADSNWYDCASNSPMWDERQEYRIKLEPKPDSNLYFRAMNYEHGNGPSEVIWTGDNGANLKLTFDGETGKLKSAEVL
jgi:hypothetical protein